MPNEDILAKISAYVDGELSPAERQEVEAALESHPEYRDAARAFREMDVLGSPDVPSISGDQWNRVWNRLREETLRTEPPAHAERTKATLLSIRQLLPLAAAALLLVGVVWFGSYWSPSDDTSKVVETSEVLETAPDTERSTPTPQARPADPRELDKTATLETDDEEKAKARGTTRRKDL